MCEIGSIAIHFNGVSQPKLHTKREFIEKNETVNDAKTELYHFTKINAPKITCTSASRPVTRGSLSTSL